MSKENSTKSRLSQKKKRGDLGESALTLTWKGEKISQPGAALGEAGLKGADLRIDTQTPREKVRGKTNLPMEERGGPRKIRRQKRTITLKKKMIALGKKPLPGARGTRRRYVTEGEKPRAAERETTLVGGEGSDSRGGKYEVRIKSGLQGKKKSYDKGLSSLLKGELGSRESS